MYTWYSKITNSTNVMGLPSSDEILKLKFDIPMNLNPDGILTLFLGKI